MSWTVHEDEYRSAEPNMEEILHQVVEEEPHVKSTIKYTKISQVFAATTPLALQDLGGSAKDFSDFTNSWLHSCGTTSTPKICRKYSCPVAPSQGEFTCHQKITQGYPFDDVSTSANAETFSTPAVLVRRGMPSPHLNPANSIELRKLHSVAPAENQLLPDWMSAHYGDRLSPSSVLKYQSISGGIFSTITADSLQGKVYETAKDQHGCRFLQRWLDTNSSSEPAKVIMNEIIPHVAELMTDQYANFLIQKLFDIMPDEVRCKVALVAAPKISIIALTPHGTFSAQKMIETISSRKEIEIVREALCKDVVRLINDTHGNHVIQKVLQRFDYADKDFIYKAVAKNCSTIARNKQGCCVIQRCLEFASPFQKATLMERILGCCLQIAQDPYGNYVLQYVLNANDGKVNDMIALDFLPHLVHLCMNKFSSNVIEKVLRGASPLVQEMYVEAMCNPEIATRLIQDDFGNYVLQTALTISSFLQAENLIATLRPLMHLIKNTPYVKKLEGKMDIISRKNEGYRIMGELDTIATRPGSENSKVERVNYGGHSFHSELREASWQTSS